MHTRTSFDQVKGLELTGVQRNLHVNMHWFRF